MLICCSCNFFQGVIRLLSTCASGSPLAAKTLLLLGISGTLKDILSGSGLVAGTTVSPALTRPPEQVHRPLDICSSRVTSSAVTYLMIQTNTCTDIRLSGTVLVKHMWMWLERMRYR